MSDLAIRPQELGIGRLFETVRDALIVANVQTGRIVLWNPSATEVFGYSLPKALGMNVEDLVPEPFKARYRAGMARYRDTGHEPYIDSRAALELPAVRKGGEEICVELSLSPLEPVHDSEAEGRFVLAIVRDVTGRKRAEEALRESEERYRLVARATNEAIWDSDILADKQIWNGAIETMFGYPAGLQTNAAWWEEHIHPGDRERVLAGIEDVLQNGGEMWSEEYRFQRADGEYSTVIDRAYVVRNEQGEPVRVIGSMMDVTERREAEEEIRRLNQSLERRVEERTAELEAAVTELRENERRLRESEERYRLVVEASNDGIVDWNVRTGEVYWNDRLFEIVGLSPSEVTPSFELFVELLHPEDRQGVTDAMAAHLERGSGYDLEFRIRHSDADYRFCHVRGETQRDEDGNASRMTGVVQDVTERKRVEEALRTSEARFRALVEQIPAITYIEAVDTGEPTANFLYVSPQIETMFGYSPEEWMADPDLFRKHLHPDDRETVLAEDERTEVTGEPFRAEYRQYTRDGRVIWVRDEAVLVHDEDGKPLYWLGVQMDITERKRYEEKLAALVEELRRSNIELEQFAYVASHDLQEPLRMVASYTQLLARRYEGKLDAEADEFIAYAVDGANRMQKLINDLLTYSRVGTRGGELKPTDSQAAFEAARANLRRTIEEAGAEVVCLEEPLPTVIGDHTQLVQLFQNLISNAIKFSREGEPVRVEVGSERRSEGEWLFWVRDNGVGIEERDKERIFRIFQRLHGKEEYEGTGIGLAVCKKIVERHGGRIWVDSEVGEGSTFYFTLRPHRR